MAPKRTGLFTDEVNIHDCELSDCRFVNSGPYHVISGPLSHCDFSGAKLARALVDGTLEECDFTGANLSGVTARRAALLVRCKFTECNFTGAGLAGFVFKNCLFEACKFRNAYLEGARFVACVFVKVDFLYAWGGDSKTFDKKTKAVRTKLPSADSRPDL